MTVSPTMQIILMYSSKFESKLSPTKRKVKEGLHSSRLVPRENLKRRGIKTKISSRRQTCLPALSQLTRPQQKITRGIGKVNSPRFLM
jgi:hypothetical protein